MELKNEVFAHGHLPRGREGDCLGEGALATDPHGVVVISASAVGLVHVLLKRFELSN